MPLILPPYAWSEWFAEQPVDEAALKGMLVAYPTERMAIGR
jgi:hypothetical protein